MKRRDKWIIIICLSSIIIIPIAYFGSFVILVIHDLNKMEGSRQILLYEIDHRMLLEACRELSKQVSTGRLEPGSYSPSNQRSQFRQFPQIIRDLVTLGVEIDKDGKVDMTMSPGVIYGVCALPEDYKGSIDELYKSDDQLWAIELIDGLWYYDEDFLKHPEHLKEVEKLLSERKQKSSTE